MVRQADIAKTLGLSESSVSRILSGKSNHDDQTRAKVLALSSELGYRHLRPTVRKVTGQKPKTPLLEVIIEADIAARAHLPAVILRLLDGISEGARMEDAALRIEYVSGEEVQKKEGKPQRAATKRGNLVGVVCIGHHSVQALQELSLQVPCVWVCNADQRVMVDSVGQNDMHATDELFCHLAALGHDRIGFLSEVPDFWPVQARLGAYAAALAKRGLPYDPTAAIVHAGRADVGDWKPAYDRVIAQVRRGVTAWICNHDDVGYGLVKHLIAQGIRVPKDVSICGFDHLPRPKELPRLTSIAWPFEDIGVTAVRRLLRRSREVHAALVSINFNGRLMPGDSTAPLGGAKTRTGADNLRRSPGTRPTA